MKTNNLVHFGGRIERDASEVLMLKAELNYTFIYFQDGTRKLVATTLGIIEKRLPKGFFRVNRSTVISLKNILPSENGNEVFCQQLGEIKISRRRKEAFLTHFNKYK